MTALNPGLDERQERLFALARGGSTEEFDRLVNGPVNVNGRDRHGMTVMHLAAVRGARPYALTLLRSGKCDLRIQDDRGRYAYQLAIQHAHDHALGRLLLWQQMKQTSGAVKVEKSLEERFGKDFLNNLAKNDLEGFDFGPSIEETLKRLYGPNDPKKSDREN